MFFFSPLALSDHNIKMEDEKPSPSSVLSANNLVINDSSALLATTYTTTNSNTTSNDVSISNGLLSTLKQRAKKSFNSRIDKKYNRISMNHRASNANGTNSNNANSSESSVVTDHGMKNSNSNSTLNRLKPPPSPRRLNLNNNNNQIRSRTASMDAIVNKMSFMNIERQQSFGNRTRSLSTSNLQATDIESLSSLTIRNNQGQRNRGRSYSANAVEDDTVSISSTSSSSEVLQHSLFSCEQTATIRTLNLKASDCFRNGDHKQALELYLKASVIARAECEKFIHSEKSARKSSQDVDSDVLKCIITASTLNSIATITWHNFENHERAIEYLQEALVFARYYIDLGCVSYSIIEEATLCLADILVNLGGVYVLVNDRTNAMDCLTNSLRLQRETLGISHHYVASTIGMIADLQYEIDYERKGYADVVATIDLLLLVLQVQQEAITSSQTFVGITLLRLAALFHKIKSFDTAITYYNEAIQYQRQRLGSVHIEVGVTLHHLATVYESKGDYFQAKKYYAQSSKIYENLRLTDSNEVVRQSLKCTAQCQSKIWHSVRSSVQTFPCDRIVRKKEK